MTTPVGPFGWVFNPASVVPSDARIARVFFMTLYSALAPRNCLRSSVTWLTESPADSVTIANRARPNFSVNSATAVAFSSLFISSSFSVATARLPRDIGSTPLLRQGNGVQLDPDAHCARNRHALEIASLTGSGLRLDDRLEDRRRIVEKLIGLK